MAKQGIVNIIGAGVAGLGVATELRARGVTVNVCDHSSGLGRTQHVVGWRHVGTVVRARSAEEPVARHGELPPAGERHAGGVHALARWWWHCHATAES